MRSVPFITCIASAILALALGWISYLAFERADISFQQSQLEAVARQFRASLAGAGRMVLAQADTIAGLPGVRLGLAQSNREDILSRLTPSFETLKTQFSLDLVQAIKPDNVVLVRVQDPKRFGDDLSKGRPMIVQANVSGQAQNGIEVGSGGLRVRAVVPVMNDDKKVGVFEVGQSIDRLLDNLRRTSGADVGLLLSAEVMRGVPNAPNTPARQRVGEMLSDTGTNWPLFIELAKQVQFTQVKENAFSLVSTAEHSYAVMQTSFISYSGQPLGNFVAIKEVDDSTRARRSVMLEIMSVALGGAVAISCLILVTFRGLVLGPVIAAAAQAEALADGKSPPALPGRKGRDGVSRLFAALERLRARRQSETDRGDAS